MTIMTKQLSVRLTAEQRSYVKEQLTLLQDEKDLSHLRWSEADVVRTLIEEARKSNREIVTLIKDRI